MFKNEKIESLHLKNETGKHLVNLHILNKNYFNDSLHTHDFFDFDFLQEGALIQFANGTEFIMKKNQVCIIRPECVHQIKPLDENDFLLYNFVVDYQFLKYIFNYFNGVDIDKIINKPYILFDLNSLELQELTTLTNLAQTNIDNRTNYDFYLKLIIFNLVKSLVIKSALNNNKNNTLPPLVSDVLIELNKPENFTKSITEICKSLSYSHEHIIRTFSKYGLDSPNKILLKNKLIYATVLLTSSNLNISEIAEKCGIFTMSHFNKAFKLEYRTSPTEYRKANKLVFNINSKIK